MSINLKIIVASLFFALSAMVFAVFSHQTQMASLDLTRDLSENGVDPLTRVQDAQTKIARLQAKFAATLSQPGADISAPLHEGAALDFTGTIASVLIDMRSAANTGISDQTRARLSDPLYLLDVLTGSRGRISGRMALRELTNLDVELEDVLSGLRRELAALRGRARLQVDEATRRNAAGLALVVVASLATAFFLSRTISRSLKSVCGLARSLAQDGAPDLPVPSGPQEVRDLVAALKEVQSHRRNTEQEMGSQVVDISARLEDKQAQLECALNNMTQALCMLDGDKRLVVSNPEFTRLFGNVKSGTHAREFFADPQLWRALREEETVGQLLRAEGGEIMEVKRRGMAGSRLLITFENITERQREVERLVYLAGYDTLTDLPNRRSFTEGVEAIIARGRIPFAVVVCELLGIKSINDTYGHDLGDALVKACAKRIETVAGSRATVARLGGNEFAVLMPQLRTAEEAEALAAAIRDAFSDAFDVDGRRLVVGISMGVVHVPGGSSVSGMSAERLIQDCDLALYQGKNNQPSGFRLFKPAMRDRLDQRREMEIDLERALRDDQIEIFYQPFVDSGARRVTGFEALMRWNHPERGYVSPTVFVPLAEEVGLIDRLGVFALETACRQAAFWPRDLIMSVNLSPVQFKSSTLVGDIRRALKQADLSAARLHIEVTESIFLDDGDRVLGILDELHRMGLSISMDDFGTGYSSLGYLSRFPFDRLKIDQSFIRNIDRAENLAIIRAIVGLSKALGLELIAEGVETAQQMRILHAEGCREMQGYFFSEPRPGSDLAAMIAEVETQWAAKFEPALAGRRAAPRGNLTA